jgi:hypothetical protein
MSRRNVRLSDELAIHFRCDLCGRIQPVSIIKVDDMLSIIADPTSILGAHVCEHCCDRIESMIVDASTSEWEKSNGLGN